MELGVHVSQFTFPGGPQQLADDLTNIAVESEQLGFTKLSVMDHVWQIGVLGPPEAEMLEAYTTLGYLAARTSKIKLLAWVTGVVYRAPGLLAKAVTTLDVLSQGRAYLGIGAAWNEEESKGLGLFFPPMAERFERLEEALQICLQMWGNDDGPYAGKHYKLERTLNSPQSLTRPHPPILIGGGGEKKTLRLVALYGDACNLFAYDPSEVERKLEILKQHCEDVGRDYNAIEKTVMGPLDPGKKGENTDVLLDAMRKMHDLGVTHYHGTVPEVASIKPLEILAEQVIPAAANF
ncbi:MAG TPA: LLM class F420-dependent oxidoreductase [Mycobacteriales bacterium]|nr:LLM class F420-dependent oxidoreductase [Mycobacteriales bacterium]